MKKITIEDVAKAAGVSRALVSIAYRGAQGVSEATAEHIFNVGRKLGYVPNLNAARLASKGLKTVGVFLQDLHNEVFADVYDGIRSVINGDELQLVLTVGSAKVGSDIKAIETLIASRVDVIIAAGLTMSNDELRRFTKRVKLISVTRKVEGAPSVFADDFLGAKIAVQHLINASHKSIAFLANPQTDGYRDRLAGYLEAIRIAKLKPLIRETTYSRADAEQDAGEILKSKPSAIFAHNDLAAIGAVDAVISAGLKPGRDVAVVGFDNTSLSQTPLLDLTSVDPHSFQLGLEAAKIAERVLAGEETTSNFQQKPDLIVRASSQSNP